MLLGAADFKFSNLKTQYLVDFCYGSSGAFGWLYSLTVIGWITRYLIIDLYTINSLSWYYSCWSSVALSIQLYPSTTFIRCQIVYRISQTRHYCCICCCCRGVLFSSCFFPCQHFIHLCLLRLCLIVCTGVLVHWRPFLPVAGQLVGLVSCPSVEIGP